MENSKYIIRAWVDGACDNRSAGKRMGIGVYVTYPDGVVSISREVGPGTNNIAEYTAFIECLKSIGEVVESYKGPYDIIIHSDSLLVVNHYKGVWKCENPVLAEYLKQAVNIGSTLPYHKFVWIPREQNTVCDGLSKECLIDIRSNEAEEKRNKKKALERGA